MILKFPSSWKATKNLALQHIPLSHFPFPISHSLLSEGKRKPSSSLSFSLSSGWQWHKAQGRESQKPQNQRKRRGGEKSSRNPRISIPMPTSSFFFLPMAMAVLLLLLLLPLVGSKSTIEPCSNSDTCTAMVGYTLYTDLKVSEVALLFQADPISILTANSVDVSFPDVENRILPSGLFLKVPVVCSCADGIRKSISTKYKARPADTLASIADTVYAGLVSADQIREANGIADPAAVDAGMTLAVPLPCTCFNSSDNNLPTVYLSYVAQRGDTVAGIAARWFTTATDIMGVNAMGSPAVKAGDILAVPLPACASAFRRYASDYGLIVANGSYAITASHCVQCSCGPGDTNMYCTPASLAVSCSSMQCRNSYLMLGNFTAQQTSAGCNVTTCSYGGYVNGTILTLLSTALQPRCPREHQFPTVIPPPTVVPQEAMLAPSPSPSGSGGVITPPKSSVPASMTLPSVSPTTSGPMGGGISGACSLGCPLSMLLCAIIPILFLKFKL